ncbi:energy transducer TonB [Bacteroides pyogenes]|uniref:energy transducer TonB n=1 Tax=Bacteroides pyogenes TaxID=310300 RepID=UPI003734FBBF
MEAKKSRKAAIENQRSSWLLMGVVVALAFMFVSFEWTRQDVKLAAYSSAHDPIFEEVLIPITHPEEKLEPPPPPDTKVTDVFNIVANDEEVETAMTISSEDEGKPYEVVWIPPVVETKEVEEDVIVVHAEVMPEFPGGTSALMKYLSTHIKYPAVSQEIGAYGRVIVQFVVDRDGTITDPVVVRGVEVHLDKEAIRVISSMPKWKPGMQNGKRVRVKYTLPVLFRLQ